MIKIIPDREGVLTQWDLNRKVLISGIDTDEAGIEVHFASPNDDHNAYVVSPVINNNIVSATIPNILLTIPGRIYVYVYTSYTQDKAIVAVAPREKPDDYVYTETEKFALEQWEKEVTEKLEGRYDKAVQEIDERYAGLRDDAITASAAAASAQTSAAAADLSATRAEAAETNAKENAKAISEVGDQVTANAKAVSDALIIVENAKSDALAAKSAAEAANEKAASSANAAKESQTATETAESNATEAAKAALQAATSATEAKDNAITAKDDAENAKGIAETAKDDAIAAKNAAEQAKTAAETAAENVPIIDDTLAAGNRTWSSQNIVERLCPKVEGSGNPIVLDDCIEDYPMKVVASWEPTQAGSGDPSPENIRAISGRNDVTVTGCGENIISMPLSATASGIKIESTADGRYHLYGTTTTAGLVKTIGSITLRPGIYTVKASSISTAAKQYGIVITLRIVKDHNTNLSWLETTDNAVRTGRLDKSKKIQITIYASKPNLQAGETVDGYLELMLVSGSTVPTAYAPFSGTTRTLALPETIYGGSVDATTGEGVITWGMVRISKVRSAEPLESIVRAAVTLPRAGITAIATGGHAHSDYLREIVSWKADVESFYINQTQVYIKISKSRLATPDLAGINAYLSEHPLTVAYRLAEPVPFTATGGSLLYQLDGINTVISDADTLTVNGRADPIKVMESQRQAIISLGGNI